MENAIPSFEPVPVTDETRAVLRYQAALMFLELQDENPTVANKWLKNSEIETVTDENFQPSFVSAPKAYIDFIQAILLQEAEIVYANYCYESTSIELQQKYDNLYQQMYPYMPAFHRNRVDTGEYRYGWIHEPVDAYDFQQGLDKSARLLKFC